jgi:vacuolar-type H+-ATPase subunit C/Vma6
VKYAYVCSKIRGMKDSILTANDFYKLSSQSLEEIYAFLRTTVYNEEVSIVPIERFDARAFEEASANNFIKTFDNILKSSPKDITPLLMNMLKRFEVENIKALLRAKMINLDVNEAIRYLMPLKSLETISYRDIFLKAGKIEDLVKLLLNTEYGPLLNLALPDYHKEGTLLPFDSLLDRYLYTALWMDASNLRGEDKRIAEEIFRTEIDMLNIKTISRCKVLGISSETIPRYIIPIFYKQFHEEASWKGAASSVIKVIPLLGFEIQSVTSSISRETLEKGINAPDVKQSLQAFRNIEPYREGVEYALSAYGASGSLSPVEMALDKVALRTNLNILKRRPFPFDIGVILSFLSLKWIEVRNLRAIVKGRETHIPPEKIEKLLILP